MRTQHSILIVIAVTALSATLWLAGPTPSIAASRSPQTQAVEPATDSLEQQIVAKEREGLDALKAGNLEQFANLTADDAILVDAHGSASKAQVMKYVAGFTLTGYSMKDVHFLPISTHTGLISYTISETGSSHGREFTAQAYVSSVWTQRGSQWVCLFSQETASG